MVQNDKTQGELFSNMTSVVTTELKKYESDLEDKMMFKIEDKTKNGVEQPVKALDDET